MLLGRGAEWRRLDQSLAAVRDGRSGVLVLRGDAGMGKTALLDHVVGAAAGLRVLRISGVESEMELPYAALHQLCLPLLDKLGNLPAPQADALGQTFGLRAGAVPGPFLVGLGVLNLLAEAARDTPVLCVIDDAQWLDAASVQVLTFVARRLLAESVLMVFATRHELGSLRGLPLLELHGLADDDARRLLASVVRWPLDDGVRNAILAEARGNPLALLELPLGRSPGALAGGFGLLEVLPLTGRIEESFRTRVDELPAEARQLLLVAAADPVGDPVLLWRAADQLGLGREAGAAAEAAGLLNIGIRVAFRHPLVRSAVYRAASPADRRTAHRALAAATSQQADPDRRAWHLAQAAATADDEVASELAASAGRAQARGGLAAAAAFLERSAALTADPERRAGRELEAAGAKYSAGALEEAVMLLDRAEAGPPDELRAARIGHLRGHLAFASGRSADAPALLLATARRFEALDPGLARETYLDAVTYALLAGRFGNVAEVAAATRHAPPADEPGRAPDLLLDAFGVLYTDGHAAGAPLVARALDAFRRNDLPPADALRWLAIAGHGAYEIWDDAAWEALAGLHIRHARANGALVMLPVALQQRLSAHLHAGEFAAAAALVDETETVAEATRIARPAYGAAAVAAWRGRAEEATALIRSATAAARERGEGIGLTLLHHTDAVLQNGLGRHAAALSAARLATAGASETAFASWALAELAEAAVRVGDLGTAASAVDRLAGTTTPSGTAWSLGVEARCRALISSAPEPLYREAIERLAASRGAVALARAHLLFGEWLRAEERRPEARLQLRKAYDMLTAIGAEAFADRARLSLEAVGEAVPRQPHRSTVELTPQERQIARRARDGRSNAEIGAELFLSARTVEWHLRKVFSKLGITNRRELRDALPEPRPTRAA